MAQPAGRCGNIATTRPRLGCRSNRHVCGAITRNVGREAPNRKLGRGHIPIELAQFPVLPAPAGIQAKKCRHGEKSPGSPLPRRRRARAAGAIAV